MTRFIQKIVFFVTILTLTNTVSAHPWPIFATNNININEDHITLDIAFTAEAGYTDEHYGYTVNTVSPLFPLINQSINNNTALLLTPTIEESEINEITYNIIFNGTNVGTINITREALNEQTLEEYKTKHQRFREAKHQILDGNIDGGTTNLVNVVTEVVVDTVKKEGKSLERRGKHWKKKYKF